MKKGLGRFGSGMMAAAAVVAVIAFVPVSKSEGRLESRMRVKDKE